MTMRKRRNHSDNEEERHSDGRMESQDSFSADKNIAPVSSAFAFKFVYKGLIVVSSLSSIVALLFFTLPRLTFFKVVTLSPLAFSLWRGLISNKPWPERILPLTLTATAVGAQLPTVAGAAVSAAAIVALGLLTLPSRRSPQQQEYTHPGAVGPDVVLWSVVLLVVVLLSENFMIWVVSASFVPGQDPATAPPPLQDNGRLLMKKLLGDIRKRDVIGLRRLWNVQGDLVSCLGVSFVLTDVFRVQGRHLYNMGSRAVLTLAAARCIRTMSFLITVLPSQRKSCYADHFPVPPPDNWKDFIWVGLQPLSHGGCNDLIISGHATVTSTMACVAASVSGDLFFAICLWSMVVWDYMVEVYEGFHYSVDMLLGMVLVCLFWRVLQPIEGPAHGKESSNETWTAPTGPIPPRDALLYTAIGVIPFLQLVVFPLWMANFLIVLYTLSTIIVYVGFIVGESDIQRKRYFLHLGQHLLYCLLYLALGVYL